MKLLRVIASFGRREVGELYAREEALQIAASFTAAGAVRVEIEEYDPDEEEEERDEDENED